MMKKLLLSLLLVVISTFAYAQETTMTPAIIFNQFDDYLEVHIYCPEEAVLYVNDESVGRVSDEYVYLVDRTYEEQTITVTAYAQADGKLPSPVVTESFVLYPRPIEQTAMPVIYVTTFDHGGCQVTISIDQDDPNAEILYAIQYSYGEQTDWMHYDGTPLMFTEEGFYTVMAYAKAEGKTDSEVTTIQFNVDQYKPEMATPPLIHPLQLSQGGTLRMNIIPDPLYVEYTIGYNPEPYTFINADAYYYSINGGKLMSTGPEGGTISLPGYGHYTIEAYGQANGALDSHQVTAIIDYDQSGYTTLFDNTIVHNGIIYEIQDDNTLLLCSPLSLLRPGFSLCYEGDIDIPACITIDGNDYTVVGIDDYVFTDMTGNITSLVLPSTITHINDDAFINCYELETIICWAQTPPSISRIIGEPYNITLYVPSDAINAYRSHEIWSQYRQISPIPNYVPLVIFDESQEELTIKAYAQGYLEMTVNGIWAGTGDNQLTYKMPRRSSDDFHVSVNISYRNNAYYFGYDSRYDNFTSLPMLYASESEQGKGLKINVGADVTNYYTLFFWTDGFEYLWPEACDYRINGASDWTRCEMGGSFYLPRYGDYTIEARGVAGDDRCGNSSTIMVDVHYGADGFYSRSNQYIVYNGLYYSTDNDDNNNVTIHLRQDESYDEAHFSLPTLSDIVIPSSFIIAGDEYIVTYVDRNNCTDANSITCLSATPIDAYFDNNENDPFFEQVTLFVPQEGLEAYKAHSEWGKFAHIAPFIGAGPGDVDGDGHINIDDVTGLIDMLLTGDTPEWADVNGDGKVNIDDITDLIDILLGKK